MGETAASQVRTLELQQDIGVWILTSPETNSFASTRAQIRVYGSRTVSSLLLITQHQHTFKTAVGRLPVEVLKRTQLSPRERR